MQRPNTPVCPHRADDEDPVAHLFAAGDVGVSPTSPSDSSLRVPQELIDRIVEHVAAPLRDSEGRLILLKDEQAAADLITLTLVPKFEAGSSRVLLGQLIIGDATRTVSDFAKAVKDSTRLARAITSLNIDLRDCDIHRSASIESLEIILARLHNLVKLRIHDSQGNTRPSLRRHAAKTEQTDESLKLSGKIQDLALSALDIDAVLQCLGLFDQITELNLENIFCSSVPLFGLSEDVALPRLAVKTLNLTGCHPAVAGLLSKIINTQHPVDTIGLYDVSFALEYRALRHLLRAIGRDTVDVTLELTNRLAKNRTLSSILRGYCRTNYLSPANSVPPKVIFSALADFWQLRSLHLYEDSEVVRGTHICTLYRPDETVCLCDCTGGPRGSTLLLHDSTPSIGPPPLPPYPAVLPEYLLYHRSRSV